MRMSLWLIMNIGAALIVGCASTEVTDEFGPSEDISTQARVCGQSPELAAGLIFDRRPGYFRATDFACRSDWPSTDSYYSPSQVIEFREHFVDYQGRPFSDWDYSYRRFDTRRIGIGYR